MNAVRNASLQAPLRTALVVSGSDGHARVDRLSLKNAKILISRAVTSGADAMAHLLKLGADVVLVDEELSDGSGWDFMRRLKADPRLKAIPVVMISNAVDREKVIEAIRLGCVGCLVRPYTLDAFFKHLALARQARCFLGAELGEVSRCLDMVDEGRAEDALPALEKALETPDDAQHYYEKGLTLLAEERYAQAVEAFTAAVRLSALMAEAHLGLARCYLSLGDEVRYRKALTQAAHACAKARRFERYKDEFLQILRADPRGFNPFLSLGMRLGREMDWDGARMALKHAVRLAPTDAKAHLELAKAQHFKREPELAKRSVARALHLSPHDDEALSLYERWTGKTWGEERRPVAGEEEQGKGQVLPDLVPAMLNGVLYLAGVVTEGIHRFRRDYA